MSYVGEVVWWLLIGAVAGQAIGEAIGRARRVRAATKNRR